MAWRGVWAGLSVYALLTAALYLTPLRLPVVQAAGSDHAAFQIRLAQQREFIAVLQRQAEAPAATSDVRATLERARQDHEVLQNRLQSWRRLHAGISPFGFMAWFSDLWPWLLSFGIAFPVLGGLIGAQAHARKARRGHPVVAVAEETSGMRDPRSALATGHGTLAEDLDKEYPPLEEGERPQMSLFDAVPVEPPAAAPPGSAAAPTQAGSVEKGFSEHDVSAPPESGLARASVPSSPPSPSVSAPGEAASPPPSPPPRPRSLEEELLETWKAPIARPSSPRRKVPPVKSPHLDQE